MYVSMALSLYWPIRIEDQNYCFCYYPFSAHFKSCNPLCVFSISQVQLSLYTYLSAEFIGTATIYSTIRRVGTVLQLMHTLKYYYWANNPLESSGITPKGLGESSKMSICRIYHLTRIFYPSHQTVLNNCTLLTESGSEFA